MGNRIGSSDKIGEGYSVPISTHYLDTTTYLSKHIGVETGVLPIVRALHLRGYLTIDSCEGHEEFDYPRVAVIVHPDSNFRKLINCFAESHIFAKIKFKDIEEYESINTINKITGRGYDNCYILELYIDTNSIISKYTTRRFIQRVLKGIYKKYYLKKSIFNTERYLLNKLERYDY